MLTLTPDVIQQLALAHLLSEQSEEDGTQFEDGTYEQGVRDALGWICELCPTPPYNPDEYGMTVQSASFYLGMSAEESTTAERAKDDEL
jgi:hypothetical protein